MPRPIPNAPEHVAVIMDGNGRWAKHRGKIRAAGHREGAKRVPEITTECAELGVRRLTLYALSAENYARRPKTEIRTLMGILRRYVVGERPTMMDKDIRFQVIGRVDELPTRVVAEIRKTEQMTSKNAGMVLCIALNYGGRAEIIDATRSLAREAKAGTIRPDSIDARAVATHLYAGGIPDVDLMIRTAGEMRISNFLLWQAWYAELYITDVLWPDFDAAGVRAAFREYARRVRKFGAVRPSPSESST